MASSPPRSAGRLSPRLTGGVVVAVLFMGSTLLTPLYDLYRSLYRLSPVALTLLYAVYVIGNLTALLFLGRLSDQRGRRPVALAGLALAGLSALVFLFAADRLGVFAGRIVSGCAVGLGSGAATAWIAEATAAQRKAEAASTMTAFNFLGLTLGPVAAGLLVQYAPWPLRLSFVIYLGLLALTAGLVAVTGETLARRPSAAFSLTPRLGVPPGVRLRFAAPAAAGFIAMAVVGFYAALGPTMLHRAIGLANRALTGAIVAELFAVAGVTILVTRKLAPRPAMVAGLLATPPALGLLLLAQALASLPLMLAGTTLCGVASALGYRGGLAVVNALAPAERRAETASTYFVCCFLGNALPIVGVGALSQAASPELADRAFGAGLSALAIAALACALAFGSDSKPTDRRAPQPARSAARSRGG